MTEHVYHYTNGVHIGQIIRAGYLTGSYSERLVRFAESVWASTNPVWEPASSCLGPPTLLRQARRVLGIYRVELDPATVPYRVEEWNERTGRDYPHERGQAARAGSDIDEWRIGPPPIAADSWLGIDVWANGKLPKWCVLGLPDDYVFRPRAKWVRVDPDRLLAEWRELMHR